MTFDAKLFDRIRVRPDAAAEVRERSPACEWAGCEEAGCYRAPKGRLREGEYHRFCLDHVRLYNKSYNYFAGMSDAAVAAFQRDAATGHRPTFPMGLHNRHGRGGSEAGPAPWQVHDPLFVFGHGRFRAEEPAPPPRRKLKTLERQALETLGLEEEADRDAIKTRFKALVKKHHPDANGGDRSSEERLRQIIQAYNALKSGGLC